MNAFFFRTNDFDYMFEDSASPGDYGAVSTPATPAYNADTPSPMGPFTPQTPGTYSPYQGTPSPAGYQGKCTFFVLLVEKYK